MDVVRRRFTIDEYYRMAEVGILTEADRVELIDGDIVLLSGITLRHAACVNHLNHVMVIPLDENAIVSVHGPIDIQPYSEPHPDIALLRRRDDFYGSGPNHPGPQETLLVIEVADITLVFDEKVKLPLYARSGITEMWIVNLNNDSVGVYRNPAGDRYQEIRHARRGEVVSPQALPDLALDVNDILI